jgi:hypothetical protein
LRRCVEDLAAADEAKRQAAARRLALRRDDAAPLLRSALLDPDLAPEARRRIDGLLDPDSARGNPARVRLSLQALHFIGTPDAMEVLADLAMVDARPGRP